MDKREEEIRESYFEWLRQRVIAQGAVLDAVLHHMVSTSDDPQKEAAAIAEAIAEAAGSSGKDRNETLEGHLSYFRSLLDAR